MFELYPKKSFHCSVTNPCDRLLLSPTLPPFNVFIWLTQTLSPPLVLLHNESVWQIASITATRIAVRAESWIRLSKPCGMGRHHTLNHLLSYRLCLPNLCHVTWEGTECVFSACLPYTTYIPVRNLSFPVRCAVAGKSNNYVYMHAYKCHINTPSTSPGNKDSDCVLLFWLICRCGSNKDTNISSGLNVL